MENNIAKEAVVNLARTACVVVLILSGWFICHAQAPKRIQIACIGNSITFGARVSDPATQGYPAVLAALIQDNRYPNCTVRNFGIGGATMLKFGTPNLWRILDSLKNFRPDIVIIKCGTNETVGKPRMNWEHIGEFEKDYAEYLASIRSINPACKVIVCSPVDMVLQTEGLSPERKEDLTLRRPRIWELRKHIKKLAKEQDTWFLDLTKPFRNKADLMTQADGVHPNQAGYQFLGTLVFDFLVKKKILVKQMP